MAWTRQKLEALERAMQSGVMQISEGGKTVRYQSLDEMRRVYEFGLAQVVAAETGVPARKRGGLIRMYQSGNGLT